MSSCYKLEIGLLDLPHCVCFSYLLHVYINVKVGHQVPITRAKFAFNNWIVWIVRLSLWRFQLQKVHSRMRFFTFCLSIWSFSGASEAAWWMTRAGLPQGAAAQECVSRVQQQQRQFYDQRPQEASGEASRLYWGELSRGPQGHLWGTWGHLGVAWKLLDISSLLAFWSLGQHFNKLSFSDYLLKVLQL